MTDITLKLTEAFNRHNSLYNALLGNLKTLTTAHTEEVTITLDAGHVRALTRILNAAPLDGDPLNTRVNVETDPADVEGEEYKAANARAIRYYNPTHVAALGGILIERTA